MNRRDVGYWALAVFSCAPLFVVERPPLQDWPFHLATVRVIHSLHDPTYGFDGVFALNLGQTQYILYHLLASALAWLCGVTLANRLMLCVYLGGTLLAMRTLARALGRDERIALLVAPLLVNVMFLFGLLPFLFAIGVMVVGFGQLALYYAAPTRARGVVVAVIALALFFLHTIPFALFGLCALALFPWQSPRTWWRAALPGLPAAVLLVLWLALTRAGKFAREALLHPSRPSPLTRVEKLRDAYHWLGAVFRDHTDARFYRAVLLLGLGGTLAALIQRRWPSWLVARYAIVPAACFGLLLVTGEAHDNVWMIWQRFPVLACITAVPLLDFPRGWPGHVATALAVMIAAGSTINTCIHFRRFEREDVGDFDGALAVMEPRKHVIGLIYDTESRVMMRNPMLHYVSYYQAEKGGVVEFTLAGYSHWPFHFVPGQCPPQGCQAKLDWEWHPWDVHAANAFVYYDYVLTRGEGFVPGPYSRRWSGGLWTVWARSSAPDEIHGYTP